MKLSILMLSAAVAASAQAQEPTREQLVYTGTPIVKQSGEPGDFTEAKVSAVDGAKYRLRIVRRGDRYYWASREDRELTLAVEGRYVVFSCSAGMIKIVNPLFDSVRAPLRDKDPTERFDYIEILHADLAVLNKM